MLTQQYLGFISRKIKSLRTAIFFDDSPAILKIPTSVITVLDVDKSGNVWFPVRRPYRDMSGLESRFFAQLQFYNKMCNYFIIIRGNAAIETDKNGFFDRYFGKGIADENEILVRILISDVEFHQARIKMGSALTGSVNGFLMRVFGTRRERNPAAVGFNI